MKAMRTALTVSIRHPGDRLSKTEKRRKLVRIEHCNFKTMMTLVWSEMLECMNQYYNTFSD